MEGMYRFILLSESHNFLELENSGSGNMAQEHKVNFKALKDHRVLWITAFLKNTIIKIFRKALENNAKFL